MVCPEQDFTWRDLALSLPWLPSPSQHRGLEVVVAEHLEDRQCCDVEKIIFRETDPDAVLDGQVVQLVGHFKQEQIFHCEEIQHPSVHPERFG